MSKQQFYNACEEKKQHCLWKNQVSYKLMAKSYLDETTCFSSMDESLETKPFIIVSEPHEKRVKGFPLDSLSIDIPSGKYYYDVEENHLADVTWIRDLRIFSKSFDEFVTQKYKIVFVLQKKVKEEKYKNI